ncbi:MAG: succinylglutamate desuccinylase [Desulfuromonas sp.]|nr:MAG: succinylglutamate desuccinylase [Desulfuromonas sp.]
MKQRSPYIFAGQTIPPGGCAAIDLPMAKLYTHTEVHLPVHIVHGQRSGPTLFVSAAIHGDEINGVEIIRRLLQHKSLQKLRGTLLAVPVVNPYGFISRSRYLPDRRDLNRSFPGSPKGSLASRLAHLFMEQIVSRADFAIDIHTGSNFRTNLPQIRACCSDTGTFDLAMAFGAPLVIDSDLRDGSLRAAVAERDVPILLYEAGEALYFNEVAIRTGVRGIINVMRTIGMLPKQRSGRRLEPLLARSTSWVRASSSGVLNKKVGLGSQVRRGEVLGVISDPLGGEVAQVVAPTAGVVLGQLNLPLIYEGDALFNLARIDGMEDDATLMDDHMSELTTDDFALER